MKYSEVKFEVFIPGEFINNLRERLNEIGACRIGNYDNCLSITKVKGSWRPLSGSDPYQGQPGKISYGEEMKVEFRCQEEYIKEAITVIKEIHPYEEPLINIVPLLNNIYE